MQNDTMQQKIIDEAEKDKSAMNRRAKTAELVLGFAILMILSLTCGLYYNLYNKDKHDEKIKSQVDEQVAHYFSIAQNDQSEALTAPDVAPDSTGKYTSTHKILP